MIGAAATACAGHVEQFKTQQRRLCSMTAKEPEKNLVDIVVRLPRDLLQSALSMVSIEHVLDRRLAVAHVIIRDRGARSSFFPEVKFGEASWDMMLTLYIAYHTDQQIDVSGLCAASNAPTTTALRHIERLVRAGYVRREPDAEDGRRTFLIAGRRLCQAVDRWLDHYIESISRGRGAT